MSEARILIVDDEPDIRQTVQDTLEDEGYEVVTAANADQAEECLSPMPPDLVLLDIWMPGTDGITLLKSWTEANRLTSPVLMISGHGNVETAVEAIRYGAYDFLEKPLSTAKLLVTIKRALQSARLREENLKLKGRLGLASELVGKGAAMSGLRERIETIAKTDSWVLITGEPGSGKGVVARVIHQHSARRDGPFVELSLAATPSVSVSTQLFGSESGGIVTPGTLEQAKGGTLVLDEITDFDLDVQRKLLSALEEQRFLRAGGNTYIDINVRIFATTNQDLLSAVNEGRFREDLYYRLNVVPIEVPPLRDHLEDIPELVEYYVNWFAQREELAYRRFSTAALNVLRNYHWPGNVRELKNLIQRMLIFGRGDEVTAQEVEEAMGSALIDRDIGYSDSVFSLPLREARDHFERAYLNHHLAQVDGNVSELAQAVGMERTHLYRKLKGLGIDPRNAK